jgi:membrane-associated phospholipid phosphatase
LARWAGALAALSALTLAAGLLLAGSPLARLDAALFARSTASGPGRSCSGASSTPTRSIYAALIGLTTLLAALIDRRRALAVAGFMALAWLVAVGLQQALQPRLGPAPPRGGARRRRGRPQRQQLGPPGLLPSGHAVATAALVVAAARALPAARLPLYLYLASVAGTRVLFGAHFPWDVVVGLAFGYAAARAVEALLQRAGLLELPLGPPRYAPGARARAAARTARAASQPTGTPSPAPTAMSSQK